MIKHGQQYFQVMHPVNKDVMVLQHAQSVSCPLALRHLTAWHDTIFVKSPANKARF